MSGEAAAPPLPPGVAFRIDVDEAGNFQAVAAGQPPTALTVLWVDAANQVKLAGPLDDEVVLLRLFAVAAMTIVQRGAQRRAAAGAAQNGSRIIVPPAGLRLPPRSEGQR